MLLFVGALGFVSCEKNRGTSNVKPIKIPESSLSNINQIVDLYESSILEVINSDNKSTTTILEQIDNVFIEKSIGLSQAKSLGKRNNVIEEEKLIKYLESIENKYFDFIYKDENQELSKNQIIDNLNSIKQNFLDKISIDEDLKEWERIIVMENVLLSSNTVFLVLDYGERIAGNGQSKKLGFGSWLKRNKRKIDCTIKSILAAAACASAVATAGADTFICVVMSIAATSCWASL